MVLSFSATISSALGPRASLNLSVNDLRRLVPSFFKISDSPPFDPKVTSVFSFPFFLPQPIGSILLKSASGCLLLIKSLAFLILSCLSVSCVNSSGLIRGIFHQKKCLVARFVSEGVCAFLFVRHFGMEAVPG